ncbi:MAG: ComEA family DNA-binding protein [Hydrogenophaga sp.]|uniref:ComEA family DNA-binding protein n=1 Tax=Hydrogenophaga sp. TaxID=1904254 RepID=UPI003D9B38B6
MLKKAITLLLSLATTIAMAAVDVNTATEADLDSVKGIGPGTSGKLLEQRKASKFKDWPDLIARVPGIGDKRAAKLSAEGLTVNGTKYQPAAAETPAPKAKAPAATTKP